MTLAELMDYTPGYGDGSPLAGLDNKEIQCPECEQWFRGNAWKAYDTHCESCGGHEVLLCPCGTCLTFDQYGGDAKREFNVRDNES